MDFALDFSTLQTIDGHHSVLLNNLFFFQSFPILTRFLYFPSTTRMVKHAVKHGNQLRTWKSNVAEGSPDLVHRDGYCGTTGLSEF